MKTKSPGFISEVFVIQKTPGLWNVLGQPIVDI